MPRLMQWSERGPAAVDAERVGGYRAGMVRHGLMVSVLGVAACSVTNPLFDVRGDELSSGPSSASEASSGDVGTASETGVGTRPTEVTIDPDTSTADATTGGVTVSETGETGDTGDTDHTSGGDAVCGDAIQEGDEQCDDGNQIDADGCLSTCQNAVCGDDIVWEGMEFCDDGNQVDDDGCPNNCAPPGCGNGKLDPGETCDDGNVIDDDGCTSKCAMPTCGDGLLSMDEKCDDGNVSDNDACLNNCVPAVCGDGVVQANVEACDDGNDSGSDNCVPGCKLAVCGDGFINAGEEECDDGNVVDGDGCSAACAFTKCGNKVLDDGEQCDPTAEPFVKFDLALCNADCKIESCFKVTNGPDKDISGNSWLDACANAVGTDVAVTLLDGEGKIKYFAHGPKNNVWSQKSMTAGGIDPNLEWDVTMHQSPVKLMRKLPEAGSDLLMVTGQVAAQDQNTYNCYTSMGDGYGIGVFTDPPVKKTPKMLVMGPLGSSSGMVRKIVGFSVSTEISYKNGVPLEVCGGGVTGASYTFILSVI